MPTFQNIEDEIDKIANLAHEISYKFEITLHGNSCNDDPEIYIKINDKTYYQEHFKGEKKFVINTIIPTNVNCNLIFGLVNKDQSKHTLIENGKIIKDMNVKIIDIKVNNLSLVKKNLFFLDVVKFKKFANNEILEKVDGLYYNGELDLTLPSPIFPSLSKVWQQKTGQKFQSKSLTQSQRNELITAVFD